MAQKKKKFFFKLIFVNLANDSNIVRSTQDNFGLIVRKEPHYSIIWSLYDYYVCISENDSAKNVKKILNN